MRIKAFLTTLLAFVSGFFTTPYEVFAKSTESKGECVIEQSSGRILYANSAEKPLPIASTTKILTAITVLEHSDDLQKSVTVPKEAEGIEGSSVYLKAGDVLTRESLLYGMMLRSGNDCAATLAIDLSGNTKEFSRLMNQTAQKAGALRSNFVNPHGLHDENHYSMARDMCYITAYAMENQVFCDLFKAKNYQSWTTKNKLFHLYAPCIGGKTGYTTKSGRCLVSAAKKEDMTLIRAVINCSTTYERSIELYEDAFSSYSKKELLKENERIDTPLGVGYVKQSFSYPLLKEEENIIRREVIPLKKPIKIGKNEEIIGRLEILLVNQLLFSTNLYKL